MKTVIEINPEGAVLKITVDWEIIDEKVSPLKEEGCYLFRINEEMISTATQVDVLMGLIERANGIVWAKFFKEIWTNKKK